MSIEERKISFVQEFLKLENEEVIEHLEKVMKTAKSFKMKEELGPLTIEQFDNEIFLSLKDSEDGNLTKAEDLKQRILQWS
ncbi:MAG TPA: hypothetical protein VK175_15520 [Leadbetterella sp.]|nr:hypothetical protein [Leadbetterella sp.]